MTIKRHPALQPLSRDHLIALLHANRLMQSASGHERFDLNECMQGFKDAWQSEIAIHFADEERLFPPLHLTETSLLRLFAEHHRIRCLILNVYLKPSKEAAFELGEALDAHVRWEEHELFPEIENSWSPLELEQLDRETASIEKSRNRKHPESSA